MESYIQRYKALQQERLRSRRQRASDVFSPATSGASDQRLNATDDAIAAGDANDNDDDVFNFTDAQRLLGGAEQLQPALSVASDEFVDAGALSVWEPEGRTTRERKQEKETAN